MPAVSEERADLKGIMATRQGRRFIKRLLDVAGVFVLTHAGEMTHASAFNEGQRSFGNRLLAQAMSWCLEEYVQMLREDLEDSSNAVASRETLASE